MDQWVKNLPINAAGKIVYPNSYIWRLNENLNVNFYSHFGNQFVILKQS